jgi:amino acid permease
MNTAKLFFGNAYLSIPNTFMFAGLFGGIFMFSFVGMINCYTMLQILMVAERYPKVGSYSQLSLKVFGKKGKIIVDISIWIMQLSCCISYLFFIGK